jgi:hypothetical protein
MPEKPTLESVSVRDDGRLVLQNGVFDEHNVNTSVQTCLKSMDISSFTKNLIANCLCLSRQVDIIWREVTTPTVTLSSKRGVSTTMTQQQQPSRQIVYIMQGSLLHLHLLDYGLVLEEEHIVCEQYRDADKMATSGSRSPSKSSRMPPSTEKTVADDVVNYRFLSTDREANTDYFVQSHKTLVVDALQPGTAWIKYKPRVGSTVHESSHARSRHSKSRTVNHADDEDDDVDDDNTSGSSRVNREVLVVVIAKPVAMSVDIIELAALLEESFRYDTNVFKQSRMFSPPKLMDIVNNDALMADGHKNWSAFLQIL